VPHTRLRLPALGEPAAHEAQTPPGVATTPHSGIASAPALQNMDIFFRALHALIGILRLQGMTPDQIHPNKRYGDTCV